MPMPVIVSAPRSHGGTVSARHSATAGAQRAGAGAAAPPGAARQACFEAVVAAG
jgi:hypothetical protein